MRKSIEQTLCSTVAFWLEQKFWSKIKIQSNKSHYENFYVFGNRMWNYEKLDFVVTKCSILNNSLLKLIDFLLTIIIYYYIIYEPTMLSSTFSVFNFFFLIFHIIINIIIMMANDHLDVHHHDELGEWFVMMIRLFFIRFIN